MLDTRNHYFEFGFCTAKNLLPKNLAEIALDEFHTLIKLQLARFESQTEFSQRDLYSNMQSLLKKDSSAYLGALRRGAKLASLNRYLHHSNIVDFVKQLGIELPTVPAEPVLHISSEKLQIPGGYFGFETHQDWPSIQGSLDCIIAWAPLTPVNSKNFPMQMIPKSHKRGLIEGTITANVYQIDPTTFNEDDFVDTIAEPGDVIFMSCWTLHRTGIKNCEGLRISTSMRWENAMEPTFIARNYPSAYKLSVTRDFITPGFPNQEIVGSIFDK